MANPRYYRVAPGSRGSTVSGVRLLHIVKSGGHRGVRRGTRMVYDLSQKEVPRESDRLAGTGRIDLAKLSDQLGTPYIKGHVAYGRGIQYAIRIHEEVHWNFKVPGTKAKYLEDPLKAVAVFFAAIVADEVHASLARSLPRIL